MRREPGGTDWSLCGWRVRSDVPLSALTAWDGDDREPEVTFRLGAVPERVEAPRFVGRRLQVGEDGTCRYEHPLAGAFMIRDGREVIAERAPGADAAHLAAILLGPALGILCHQRGLVPLHACCVEIDDEAIAITGPSGAGKSTLAAAFMHAGHRVLADDLTVIDPRAADGGHGASGPGRPLALPTVPRLKLSAEVLELLGVDAGDLPRSPTRPHKRHLPIPGAFQSPPLPLRAIYHLASAERGERARVERSRSTATIAGMMSGLYAPRMATLIVGRRNLFHRISQVAVTVGATYRLWPGWGKGGLEEVVARVASRTRSDVVRGRAASGVLQASGGDA